MDVPELTAQKLADLFIEGARDEAKRPILILGAGASIPSLPSAYDLKKQIASNAVQQAFASPSDGAPLSRDDQEQLEDALKSIESKCAQEHVTLEVLVSLITFRSGDSKLDTDAMWQALCQNSVVNEFSYIVALLVKLGCVSKILTSNFDHILEDACDSLHAPFRVVTNVQLENRTERTNMNDSTNEFVTEICPFHGTTYSDPNGTEEYTGPFTATAIGLAKPFTKTMYEYIEQTLSSKNEDGDGDGDGRPIIVFGYSGNDHYDLNPLLSTLKLDQTETRKNWWWVIHAGNANYCSQFVRNIFGAGDDADALKNSNALYGADTLSLMRGSFELVKEGLDQSPPLPDYTYHPSSTTYQERLGTWFANNFQWTKEEALNMILDLKHNMAAAWIVSEHYRLIQIGYDEMFTMRFAGVFEVDSASRIAERHPHLALTFAESQSDASQISIEFGYILEAARIYRIEMNDEDQAFEVTGGAMRTFIEQAKKAEAVSPRQSSETAALHVGLAIAYDYLGLIGGRKVTKALRSIKKLKRENGADTSEDTPDFDEKLLELESQLDAARNEASDGFEACIKYAEMAKERMTSSLDKLIPATIWMQVGLDNMGRFKTPGSDEAVEWLVKAIKGRKALIENDIQLSIASGETNLATSKIISLDMHFPPLWRRGGELVQQCLETQGFNSAPNKMMADLSQDRRDLVNFGFETSENAFSKYSSLSKNPNLNFPAVYDVRVLVALADDDVKTARNAVKDCRTALLSIPESTFAEAKLKSTAAWINNIEARIEDFVIQRHQQQSCKVIEKNLIGTLTQHFAMMKRKVYRGWCPRRPC